MIWYRGSLCGTVERSRVIARATTSGFGREERSEVGGSQRLGFHATSFWSLRHRRMGTAF